MNITEYSGQIILDNELSDDEYDFYTKWVFTRKIPRNDLTNGCYSLSEEIPKNLPEDLYVVLKNVTTFLPYVSPDGHPSMWCYLTVCDDKKTIIHNIENSYDSVYVFSKWIAYISEHFFNKNPMAKKLYPKEFGFLSGNQLNGFFLVRKNGINFIKLM